MPFGAAVGAGPGPGAGVAGGGGGAGPSVGGTGPGFFFPTRHLVSLFFAQSVYWLEAPDSRSITHFSNFASQKHPLSLKRNNHVGTACIFTFRLESSRPRSPLPQTCYDMFTALTRIYPFRIMDTNHLVHGTCKYAIRIRPDKFGPQMRLTGSTRCCVGMVAPGLKSAHKYCPGVMK